jgi:hypothetical protein
MRDQPKKEDYNRMAREKLWKFQQIAKALGKDHPITKMMGSRAWGRHNFEQGVEGTLHSAITESASLSGAFDVINTWAHDNDYNAQQTILKIWHDRK